VANSRRRKSSHPSVLPAESTYRTADWESLLAQHPMFGELDAQERDWLLSDQVSRELHFEAGAEIIKIGEWTNAVYLVGVGSVQVLLPIPSGGETILAPLGEGECFGEMAAIEQRPRSATVVCRDPCTLLRIDGQEFVALLRRHPNIEFKMLLKISERLRGLGEAILHDRLDSVDQRIELFATRLEAERQSFDATRKAAEAFFQNTLRRTDEVIANAERNNQNTERTLHLMTWVGSVIGAVASALVGFLAWFGITEIKDLDLHIDKLKEQSEEVRIEVDSRLQALAGVEQDFRTAKDKLSALEGKIDNFDQARLALYRTLVDQALMSETENVEVEVTRLYRLLLTSGYQEIALDLLTGLWQRFVFVWGEDEQADAGAGRRGILLDFIHNEFHENPSALEQMSYPSRVVLEFLNASGRAILGQEEEYAKSLERLKRQIAAHDFGAVRSHLRDFYFDPEAFLGVPEPPDKQSTTAAESGLSTLVRKRILDAWGAVP
jgi:CRP-like cAMP-binding protein